MEGRIILLLILPSVQSFQCTENFENATRSVLKIRHYGYRPVSVDETFVVNSTILCSNLDNLTADTLQYEPQNYEQLLRIEDSNISTLPTSAFSKMTNLTKLYLRSIKVRFILPDAFRNLKKLRELYLADNELTEVSKGIFNSLQELETLDLSNNQIRTIEDFAFMGIDNLKRIFLGRNQLVEIDVNIFQGVKTLDILDLYKNLVEKFSIDSMSIGTLNLSSNDLQTVDFYKFPKFENVDFSQNRISLVHGTPGKVKILILSQNEIETLNISFNRSTDLLKINLRFNQITFLAEDIFEGLCSLYSLDLSHNNLSLIQEVLFHDLENLVFLNLSHNQIERFRYGTFNSLKNLTSLDVSHNRLLELNYHTFFPMSDLTSLHFESNQISSLNAADLTRHFTKLSKIFLADNLWKCKDLASISQRFKQDGVKVLGGHRFDVENLYGVACNSQVSVQLNELAENSQQLNERPLVNTGISIAILLVVTLVVLSNFVIVYLLCFTKFKRDMSQGILIQDSLL